MSDYNVWDSGAQRYMYRWPVSEAQARAKAAKMNEQRRLFWLDVETINPGIPKIPESNPICVCRIKEGEIWPASQSSSGEDLQLQMPLVVARISDQTKTFSKPSTSRRK